MITPRLKAYPAPVLTGEAVSAGTSHWYMLQMVGTGKRVLEFGCASGYMSARMKEAGCHVTGVDIDVDAIEEARAVCDRVVVADLDLQALDAIVPDLAYDVLVFGDVLEHLRDPWLVLDDARRFIAPGGYAVLSIPNVAHGSVRLKLLQGDFDYSELGILDDTHLRFFTLKSVEELCLRTGYRIEAIERTKVPFFQETPLTPSTREMHFDPELIEQIRRDPEHDTLQFVLRISPLDDTVKFEVLARELSTVRDRLRVAESSARLSQEAYEEVEAELEQRERAARLSTNGEVALLNVTVGDDADSRRPASARHRGKTISARAVKRAEAFAAANERAVAELTAIRADLEAQRGRCKRLEESLEVVVAQRSEAERATVMATSETAKAIAAERANFAESMREEKRRSDKEIERLSAMVRSAQDKYVDVKQAHARCAERDEEHAKFRETMTAAVRRFICYADGELARVQARVIDIDAAIVAVQGSKFWSIKRALRKLRR